MRLTVNREILSGICRNLARIVPPTSPVADLTGILMEADENTGKLCLTANNLEIAILYECPAAIEEGGKAVLNARLMAQMMPLLAGGHVLFDTPKNGIAHIQSESAHFHISCLPGTHYPKPALPDPEGTVTLSGLRTLAKQTAFAARKPSQDANIYSNVRIEAHPSEVRMTATDTVRLAIARHRQASGGKAVFLIPVSSLQALAAIAGDELVQAGSAKNTLVFKGKDYVFTTRTMTGEFMDVNGILKALNPLYDALVPARELWNGADSLGAVAGEGFAALCLKMSEAGISLACEGENAGRRGITEAIVYRPTPEAGFYYGISSLLQALRFMTGNVRLSIDRGGVLLLKSEDQCCLLAPVRPRKPDKASEESKPKTKTKSAKTKSAKAA